MPRTQMPDVVVYQVDDEDNTHVVESGVVDRRLQNVDF